METGCHSQRAMIYLDVLMMRNKILKKIVHKCVSYHFLTEWKCSMFKGVILLYDTIHLSAWAVKSKWNCFVSFKCVRFNWKLLDTETVNSIKFRWLELLKFAVVHFICFRTLWKASGRLKSTDLDKQRFVGGGGCTLDFVRVQLGHKIDYQMLSVVSQC